MTMKVLVLIVLCLWTAVYSRTSIHNGDEVTDVDCIALWAAGGRINGTYTVILNGVESKIPCYFYDNYVSSIVLNRVDGEVSWDRPYGDYVIGFGELLHDYFSGLENIHQLTKKGDARLQVKFMDWDGNEKHIVYEKFKVDSYANNYRATLGKKLYGNAEDHMNNINGMIFHTRDTPDQFGKAESFKTGWWFNDEVYALPTGLFYDKSKCCPITTEDENGILWGRHETYQWKYSLQRLTMTVLLPRGIAPNMQF